MLLALQMLPEICLLLGSTVAHGAVELSAGSHTHGQVPGDALPRSGVVVRPWEEEGRECNLLTDAAQERKSEAEPPKMTDSF